MTVIKSQIVSAGLTPGNRKLKSLVEAGGIFRIIRVEQIGRISYFQIFQRTVIGIEQVDDLSLMSSDMPASLTTSPT